MATPAGRGGWMRCMNKVLRDISKPMNSMHLGFSFTQRSPTIEWQISWFVASTFSDGASFGKADEEPYLCEGPKFVCFDPLGEH